MFNSKHQLLSPSLGRQVRYLAQWGTQGRAGQDLGHSPHRGRVSDGSFRSRSAAGRPGPVLPAPSDPRPTAARIATEPSPARPGDQDHFPHGRHPITTHPEAGTAQGFSQVLYFDPYPRPGRAPSPSIRARRGPASLLRRLLRAGPLLHRSPPSARDAGAGME